jgi:hypothetical protein
MIKYAMDELKFLASLARGNVEVSSVTGVWQVSLLPPPSSPSLPLPHTLLQSDNLIPEDLVNALKKGVAVLENVAEDKKDWHPDSGSKVISFFSFFFYPFYLF